MPAGVLPVEPAAAVLGVDRQRLGAACPGVLGVVGGAGGGCGFIDSQGVAGGQGQDFTLNYFFRGGVERIVDRNLSLTAGVLFQHLSNGGRTDPNPGLNGFGFTVGEGSASGTAVSEGVAEVVASGAVVGTVSLAASMRNWLLGRHSTGKGAKRPTATFSA